MLAVNTDYTASSCWGLTLVLSFLLSERWTQPVLCFCYMRKFCGKSRVYRVLVKSLKVLEFWGKKFQAPESHRKQSRSLKSPWIWMFHILKFLPIKILKKASCKIAHQTRPVCLLSHTHTVQVPMLPSWSRKCFRTVTLNFDVPQVWAFLLILLVPHLWFNFL